MKELTKEDLQKYARNGYLTVGALKKFIAESNLPDDALVMVQRVEDIYYENHNWSVYLKDGEHTFNAKQFNRDIESGKYLDKEQYPDIIPEKHLNPIPDDVIALSREQYTPVWSYVDYKDDKDILFLDLHY